MGPLAGIRVVELGGIGPVPHAGLLLADMGAEVTRIDRRRSVLEPVTRVDNVLHRGKRRWRVDLKAREQRPEVFTLLQEADVVLEGFRPGVAERLGFGPEEMFRANPRLVYGRMTGWGQTGPWSQVAGHDLNYLAISGFLHNSGQADGYPQFPANLLGDYGGGSMYLVAGVLAALYRVARGGMGGVIDAAIIDGTGHLLSNYLHMMNLRMQDDRPQSSIIDGAAPFYRVYPTADGRHFAIAALEPAFFKEFLDVSGIDFPAGEQYDKASWSGLGEKIRAFFSRRSFASLQEQFAGTDCCVTPVLSVTEAVEHPQVRRRGSIRRRGEGLMPGVAPHYTPASSPQGGDSQ